MCIRDRSNEQDPIRGHAISQRHGDSYVVQTAVSYTHLDVYKRQPSESEPVSASVSTLIPYDVTQPFSTSDLTSAQMNQLRASGRISVSDGPRGISVGDSLDTLLSRYPVSYTHLTAGKKAGESSWVFSLSSRRFMPSLWYVWHWC